MLDDHFAAIGEVGALRVFSAAGAVDVSRQAEEAPELFYHCQSRTVAGSSTVFGLDEGWAAPIAVFDACRGFGEAAWLDAMPGTVVATRLHGAPVTWRCGRRAGRTSREGATALQVKGTPNHATADGALRFGHIYLSDRLIDRVADAIRPGAAAGGGLRDDLVFLADRELDRRITALLALPAAGGSLLEIEANAILVISHLLRVYHGFGEARPTRGGLAPWQLKRTQEAMLELLDAALGLDDLAGIAGCSPTHFSRAFKQSTGVPPFQWLLERRIERAQGLLADPAQSLAGIALAVGFAAQPQFTTAFRRVTGMTPGAWRRGRLS